MDDAEQNSKFRLLTKDLGSISGDFTKKTHFKLLLGICTSDFLFSSQRAAHSKRKWSNIIL